MDGLGSLREFGSACIDRDAYTAAIIALTRHLQENISDSRAWHELAEAHKVLYQFDSARRSLMNALSYSPAKSRWSVMASCASLEERSGNHEACETWYERAFCEPHFTKSRWPYVLRGTNLLYLQRYADAEGLFRQATTVGLDTDENNLHEAWHMLGVSLLAQDRLSEASQAFESALAVNPEYELSAKVLAGFSDITVAREMSLKANNAEMGGGIKGTGRTF